MALNYALKLNLIWIVAVFVLMTLSGCSGITKEEAEKTAKEFVGKRVKFYTKEDDLSAGSRYSIRASNSYQENGMWVVVVHVSASTKNETKKNDLTVKIGKNGEVAEFNGVKV